MTSRGDILGRERTLPCGVGDGGFTVGDAREDFGAPGGTTSGGAASWHALAIRVPTAPFAKGVGDSHQRQLYARRIF